VLGASVKGIFVLIVKDFVFLVAISSLIASPFAFYFLNNWLNGYYYHISISPAVFILSAAGAIVLALITISLKALRAAGMAPVKSLRSK
jgi:ABC-type antimicrobial peptide transport system permease subunit